MFISSLCLRSEQYARPQHAFIQNMLINADHSRILTKYRKLGFKKKQNLNRIRYRVLTSTVHLYMEP